MIFVKPKAGLRVRHPEKLSETIPVEGCTIESSVEVQRLINSGDLEVVAQPVAPSKKEGV